MTAGNILGGTVLVALVYWFVYPRGGKERAVTDQLSVISLEESKR